MICGDKGTTVSGGVADSDIDRSSEYKSLLGGPPTWLTLTRSSLLVTPALAHETVTLGACAVDIPSTVGLANEPSLTSIAYGAFLFWAFIG